MATIRRCSTIVAGDTKDGVNKNNHGGEGPIFAFVDRKFRSTNPDGLDSEKYVKGLCNILYSLDPMKYPYLAGLSNQHGQSAGARQRRDQSIATMLILVVVVFGLCNVIRIIINAYEVSK